MAAALARLERAAAHAEGKSVQLLLENMNWEPDRAEVHYLGHSVEECRHFFDRITSPALKWSFTINHATLVPDGIAGFLDAMPAERLGEVRLADNNGEYELHMYPGTGIVDFADTFSRIEATGYGGHYTAAFGSIDDMLRARPLLAASYDRA
jgi:sugar phosphate isomerase/epimerase